MIGSPKLNFKLFKIKTPLFTQTNELPTKETCFKFTDSLC